MSGDGAGLNADSAGSTRLAHIAALDDALEHHLNRLAEAERRQVEVHEANAAAIREIEAVHEKAHREAQEAAKERQDAYYAAQQCERAIRTLGYVVLDGKRTVAPNASRLDGHGGNFTKPLFPPVQHRADADD